MTNNFGDGYPSKTWKDAAAEVAWKNHVFVQENSKDAPWVYMDVGKIFTHKVPHFAKINPKNEYIAVYGRDFPAFRAAFLDWLKQNERREGCQM